MLNKGRWIHRGPQKSEKSVKSARIRDSDDTHDITSAGTFRKMLHFPPNYFFSKWRDKEKGLQTLTVTGFYADSRYLPNVTLV